MSHSFRNWQGDILQRWSGKIWNVQESPIKRKKGLQIFMQPVGTPISQHGWFVLLAVTKRIFFKKFESRSQTFYVAHTELLRHGTSIPEAMKLARHSDVKMTMKRCDKTERGTSELKINIEPFRIYPGSVLGVPRRPAVLNFVAFYVTK